MTLNLGNHSPKIGALNNSVQNFNGKIDQVRIYITDLGATQVEDLYTDETTTTASSLSFPSGETATATYQLDGNGDDVSGTSRRLYQLFSHEDYYNQSALQLGLEFDL